jgi:hypothetical protein
LIKPYFKSPQVFFFILFEFKIEELYLHVKTKFAIITSCLAKDKLYSEIESWTFHTPMVDDVVERLFNFYNQFDDFSKFPGPNNGEFNFPNLEEGIFPKLLPNRFSPKPLVDF